VLAIGAAAISIGCGSSVVGAPVDPFVGDWKLNPARTSAIDTMKVQSVHGDTYAFDLGGASETIAVDGTDQRGYSGTTLSVTVEGPDRWKVVRKQDDRVLITAIWKLSQDGNTLSDDFTEYAPNGDIAAHVSYVYRRTADGPGFAGTWESPIATENIPSSMLQIRPYEANGLALIQPSQDVIRNIVFDGKDHPVAGHGAAEGSTSSARRLDERKLEVTDKSKGTIRKTEQIELSPDLKTLTKTAHPVGQRGPNILVFERQARSARS
jgi:hypothetical protein